MKNENKSLTGLRGLLALSIVLYHIYGSSVLEGYIPEQTNSIFLLNYAGPISVNLFFVISGYLITGSLVSKGSIWEFAKNRFLRIYPVFLTIHLMIFAVGPFVGYKWMTGISVRDYIIHFFSNALMLPGIFPLPIAQIVAWSLSYELAFYLIAASVWATARSCSLPRIAKYAVYALLVTLCVVLVYYRKDMLFFAVGVIFYISRNSLSRSWDRSPGFYFSGIIYLSGMFWSYYALDTPIIIALPLAFLLFIGIVQESGLLAQLLRSQVMHYLGRISFSLYMWHTMVMFGLKILAPKLSAMIGAPTFWVYAVLSLSLSLIVSDLSYRIIERWFTDRIRKTKKAVSPDKRTALNEA
ncbi:acyltransferase family protein [Paenibacillus farraposensis]|uniref:Acyltransferase family protein n=1 Tax=Paenibacillus farraposensis TaxID=2807095 RepID=A0ABW4D8K6_9BACL|nr:acyltransferase [Paenibacillus farraposensis]MCC3381715.1 acyltransferase [Paenibacillus farraposensis]